MLSDMDGWRICVSINDDNDAEFILQLVADTVCDVIRLFLMMSIRRGTEFIEGKRVVMVKTQ